jgi:hypothetical protein
VDRGAASLTPYELPAGGTRSFGNVGKRERGVCVPGGDRHRGAEEGTSRAEETWQQS